MHKMDKISVKELANLLSQKKTFEIEISEDILRFEKDLPGTDFSKKLEVAPTYIDVKLIAAVLTHAKSGPEGLYTQMVVLVYADGGKILYQKAAGRNYTATVSW